jgi:N-acetylmuramoyl-L-alanine amidase
MKYAYYIKKFWPVYLITGVLCILLTAGMDQAVTTIAENIPVPRNHTIVIDAGHGGEDGGATSCSGVLESQINLQIALRLRDMFHLLGYQTLMIRTTDISVYTEGNTIAAKKISDLRQRARMVNEVGDSLLISIHQNTFPIEKYRGAQVFYNEYSQAKELAQQLQTCFVASINPGSKRKCKSADGIYLMDAVKRPAVLVECGFLSNMEEEAKLREKVYQQKICCVIASCVSSHLNS